jgi:hypothetical protein
VTIKQIQSRDKSDIKLYKPTGMVKRKCKTIGGGGERLSSGPQHLLL